MFGVLYRGDDGTMIFKVCTGLMEARYYADNIACTGVGVTVFGFNQEDNSYVELFTIELFTPCREAQHDDAGKTGADEG